MIVTFQPALDACLRRSRQLGVPPSRYIIVVSVTRQSAGLFERFVPITPVSWTYLMTDVYRCSTSRFGTGQLEGSNCTPLGLHRIAEKIGGGWPAGAALKYRQVIGFTWQGMPEAKITSRILWLDGLESGFNRGGNVDSHARYIYIHGTGDETTLGHPASCGCIHLAADDLIPLYDKLPGGTLVWISPA